MPWWGWFVVGTLLLGAELFAIPADFYLVFVGAAAIAVGLLGFVGLGLPVWAQWALFGAFAVAFLVTFRRSLKARLRPGDAPSHVDDTLLGEVGTVVGELAGGGVGRIELRGAPWTARNLDPTPLEPGARARVERVDGLTLGVRRAP